MLEGVGQRNSRWLVDYRAAKESEEWSQWVSSEMCARVVIFGEYIYARCGLTEDRSKMQSFLMFTNDTELGSTSFQSEEGSAAAIYIPLAEEQ
jgi:hypothetical protein